ncbi:MAG: hypothetical protein GY834_12840, partial [Bacteroidetes bacterium]|nr:hypothetical protein [Bacteroidota bacterium]
VVTEDDCGELVNTAWAIGHPEPEDGSTLPDVRSDNSTWTTTIGNCGPCELTQSLDGYVWFDVDKNGIQNTNESGVEGIVVELYNCNDVYVAETATGTDGLYNFADLDVGDYYVLFDIPAADYELTTQDAGTDNSIDSDAAQATGRTSCITLEPCDTYSHLDAGLVLVNTDPIAPCEIGIVMGDPHFYGPDGGSFDFHGENNAYYSILSDQNLDLIGKFGEVSANATVIMKSGLNIDKLDGSGEQIELRFKMNGVAKLNGVKLVSLNEHVTLPDGTIYKYRDLKDLSNHDKINNKIKLLDDYDIDKKRPLSFLRVFTAEGYLIEHVAVDNIKGGFKRVDIAIRTPCSDGIDNGMLPDGLVGQTFDEDDVPVMEGDFNGYDYEVDKLSSRF